MNHDFDEEKCRETCDICWGDGGQQWPCAKAAGVCARSPGRQAAGSTPALVTSSAATPVVPPSGPDMPAICAALGFDPTNHHNAAKCPYCRPSLAASPSPRTPEQPEQRPDSDHPVGE